MIIDTHSHIYSKDYSGEIEDVINRAKGNAVKKILMPNIDSSTIKRMLDLSDKYEDLCYPMMGIHPTSVKEDYKEELELMEYWLKKRKFYGIGEIGIDLYWDKVFVKEQEIVFRHQLNYAKELDLPVVIHIRESFDMVIKNIKKEYCSNIKGVFHCFTGNLEQAKQVLDLGFKIGVGGIVTFKNAGIDKVISQLNPEDIILETDAPYLAPVPFRGKRNESSYIIYVLKKVASLFDMPEEKLAFITTNTAESLFQV